MNHPKRWQSELSHLISSVDELAEKIPVAKHSVADLERADRLFKIKIPEKFLNEQKQSAEVLKQFIPSADELIFTEGYTSDPLNEKSANKMPGLLHKYTNRVLLTLTSACAIHCRYCFRRSFPYADNNPGREGWQKMFDYISDHPEVNEVILSGGDPLTLKDELLVTFTEKLSTLKQIKRLRIHTRVPVVMPSRLTPGFFAWIQSLPWPLVIVIHVNHAHEISDDVRVGLKKLRELGVHLLNQSVLLKDVNDKADVLIELSETLFACGVLPYYLHLLDKVEGAAHFAIDDEIAFKLHKAMTHSLPGYLVPKLVREEAGKKSKTMVG